MKFLLLLYFPILLLFVITLLNWRVSKTSITGRTLELKTGTLWSGLRWSGLGLASFSFVGVIWLAITTPSYFLEGVFLCSTIALIATILLLFGTARRFAHTASRNSNVEQDDAGKPDPVSS